jgi:hypothetical protein
MGLEVMGHKAMCLKLLGHKFMGQKVMRQKFNQVGRHNR